MKEIVLQVPDELSRLTNLEHLQMTCNTLSSVHGELSDLPRLRSVIVRHNQVRKIEHIIREELGISFWFSFIYHLTKLG